MSKPARINTNIRWLRKLYGETQEELAQAIYVQKNTISQYESGSREPDREKLQAIADHYMIPVDRLVFSFFHLGLPFLLVLWLFIQFFLD